MPLANFRGRVAFVFEEPNFDIDQIVGVKNIKVQDLDELKSLVMSSYDPEFAAKVRPGDLLVGAENFGYGHPHYPPMRIMRHLGISAVIAESFAPLYYSIEISAGFPQLTCSGILGFVSRWDEIEVDWENRRIVNHSRVGQSLGFEPMSKKDLAVLASGGVVPYLKREIASGRGG